MEWKTINGDLPLKSLVRKTRSIRRFDQQQAVDLSVLTELVDLARLTASTKNLQPLKYVISRTKRTNSLIFPTLAWAGYLQDWDGPEEGERPCAYIIILTDTKISQSAKEDVGIAAQTILLGASQQGLGGCMIGSVERKHLCTILEIPDHLEIALVIALGIPKETVVLEEAGPGGDIRYWRDASGMHHVPKRGLESILLPGKGEEYEPF